MSALNQAMAQNKKTNKNQPHKPKQKRSEFTYQAILEAATQLFIENGLEKTTTNKVAARAGVSIGSLYQYFPNKHALVTALTEAHLEQMMQLISTRLAPNLHRPIEDVIKSVVTLMIEAHSIDPGLHRVLIDESNQGAVKKQLQQFEQRLSQLIKAFLELKRDQLRTQDLSMAAFVMINTIETLTHRAVLNKGDNQDIALPQDKERLVDHTCDLVVGYLVSGEHKSTV